MNPWLVFWAPQLTLPFGGSVAQRIEPNTNWFFDAISPTAGDGTIERQAFEVASYGRQLGLITEVVIDLARRRRLSTAKGKESLERLQKIQARIDDLKNSDAVDILEQIDALMSRLAKNHPERLAEATARIGHLLTDGKPTE